LRSIELGLTVQRNLEGLAPSRRKFPLGQTLV
jgi:hypothetical protein